MLRRPVIVFVLLFAVTAAALVAAAQRRDPGGAAPQRLAASGTAVLAGTLETTTAPPAPVRHAVVRLADASGGSARVVGTDSRGRFAFTALPAGSYHLSATKVGYVPAVYGARRPGRAGVPIAIAQDQRLDVTFAMAPGAVITGRISDAHGGPAPMVPVTAVEVRPSGAAPGPPARATTDDRGIYRIHGLPAGDYVVSALPRLGTGRPLTGDILGITAAERDWMRGLRGTAALAPGPLPPPGRPVTFAPVFFAGTARVDAAAVVAVGPGEERGSIDFALQVVPTARISGTLLDDRGQPVTAASVSLHPRRNGRRAITDALVASRALVLPAAVVDAPAFSIGGVVPGDYTLVARTGTAGRRRAVPLAAQPDTLWHLTDISIDGYDQTDLVLRLLPGAAVSGRIVFEASPAGGPADATRAAIRLIALDPLVGGPMSPAATVDTAGTFRFRSVVPGAYALDAAVPASPQWVLISATLDGREIADDAIELRAGQDVADLVLTFSDRSSGIRGRLVDAANQAVTRYTIVVFTTHRAWWRPHARRIRSTIPATDGTFAVTGLPAGEYAIAAVDDVEPADLADPAFLSQLLASAYRIALAAGEAKVQDLRVGSRQP